MKLPSSVESLACTCAAPYARALVDRTTHFACVRNPSTFELLALELVYIGACISSASQRIPSLCSCPPRPVPSAGKEEEKEDDREGVEGDMDVTVPCDAKLCVVVPRGRDSSYSPGYGDQSSSGCEAWYLFRNRTLPAVRFPRPLFPDRSSEASWPFLRWRRARVNDAKEGGGDNALRGTIWKP